MTDSGSCFTLRLSNKATASGTLLMSNLKGRVSNSSEKSRGSSSLSWRHDRNRSASDAVSGTCWYSATSTSLRPTLTSGSPRHQFTSAWAMRRLRSLSRNSSENMSDDPTTHRRLRVRLSSETATIGLFTGYATCPVTATVDAGFLTARVHPYGYTISSFGFRAPPSSSPERRLDLLCLSTAAAKSPSGIESGSNASLGCMYLWYDVRSTLSPMASMPYALVSSVMLDRGRDPSPSVTSTLRPVASTERRASSSVCEKSSRGQPRTTRRASFNRSCVTSSLFVSIEQVDRSRLARRLKPTPGWYVSRLHALNKMIGFSLFASPPSSIV
mmetsp:Transcript_29462/g.96186  ORF Transcript_29462/g.96186 Transcript_29462/m.96186 type:complete len:328 (+) Transcript_29462:1514-2497(+)